MRGFQLDPRRLIVALNRAKRKMILGASRAVFGLFSDDDETFANAQLWKNLLRGATGRSILNIGGSGSCGMPVAKPSRMSCGESWVFAPPPRGTRLTLVVALLNPSGHGALPGSPWRVSFTMP